MDETDSFLGFSIKACASSKQTAHTTANHLGRDSGTPFFVLDLLSTWWRQPDDRGLRVFWDRTRDAPVGWVPARSLDEVIRLIDEGGVVRISVNLDSNDDPLEGRVLDLLRYLKKRIRQDPTFIWPEFEGHAGPAPLHAWLACVNRSYLVRAACSGLGSVEREPLPGQPPKEPMVSGHSAPRLADESRPR